MAVTEATLYINRWNSRCGNCNRDTSPHAITHDEVIGYRPGPGCGAKFTSIASDYGLSSQKHVAMRMRPDLPWVDVDLDLTDHT